MKGQRLVWKISKTDAHHRIFELSCNENLLKIVKRSKILCSNPSQFKRHYVSGRNIAIQVL